MRRVLMTAVALVVVALLLFVLWFIVASGRGVIV